jgi:hypothetical protein
MKAKTDMRRASICSRIPGGGEPAADSEKQPVADNDHFSPSNSDTQAILGGLRCEGRTG